MTLLFWRTVLPSALRTVTEDWALPREAAVCEERVGREGVTALWVVRPLEERAVVLLERTELPAEELLERTALPAVELLERTVLPLELLLERVVDPPMLKEEPDAARVVLPELEERTVEPEELLLERTVLPVDALPEERTVDPLLLERALLLPEVDPLRTGFCEETEGELVERTPEPEELERTVLPEEVERDADPLE